MFFAGDIRGTLVWPTPESPGYYCILAQQTHINESGKLPIVLLTEYEALLPKQIFQQLQKDSRKYSCEKFYNDFKKENEDLRTLFYDFCRYQRVENIELLKAPLVGKLHIGVALIQEWVGDKAIKIPDSTLRKQLSNMEIEHLQEKPEKFYAVNALQFLIASIEKEPWQAPMSFSLDQGAYARHQEKADARGWT